MNSSPGDGNAWNQSLLEFNSVIVNHHSSAIKLCHSHGFAGLTIFQERIHVLCSY